MMVVDEPPPSQAWDVLLGFDIKTLYATGYAVTGTSLAVAGYLAAL